MICIGGVCVPYSAVIPLIMLGIKWAFAKLYQYGLLPAAVADLLSLNSAPSDQKETPSPTTDDKPVRRGKSSKCCPTKPAVVAALESEEQFDDLIKKNEKVVLKFTAEWCQPCKKIHPFYQRQCKEYNDCTFLTVDVDEFDEISQKYNVAMMPSFVVLQGSSVVGTYSGSGEPQLEEFLRTNLQ